MLSATAHFFTVSHHVHSTVAMADKQGAYGNKAADTDFRRKWDKEEYAERAKKKDDEERDRMKENEERMKQGSSLAFHTAAWYNLHTYMPSA